jgi:hypothetical protein
VEKTHVSDWREREVAQLRDEVAFLRRLLQISAPRGQESADTHGYGSETSAPQRTLSKKKTLRGAR